MCLLCPRSAVSSECPVISLFPTLLSSTHSHPYPLHSAFLLGIINLLWYVTLSQWPLCFSNHYCYFPQEGNVIGSVLLFIPHHFIDLSVGLQIGSFLASTQLCSNLPWLGMGSRVTYFILIWFDNGRECAPILTFQYCFPLQDCRLEGLWIKCEHNMIWVGRRIETLESLRIS